MGLGADIKEVFQEIGVAYNIIRDGGNISGEYLLYKENRQVTKPFIREHFLETTHAYDTECVPGDVIGFTTTGDAYMVMNLTPSLFENQSYQELGVIYKCNVSGELQRPSEQRSAQTYLVETVWQTIKSPCYGLLTGKLFGSELDQESELGQLGIIANTLYVPSNVGAQPLDRYQPVSGEYYKVEVVEKRKFPGVDILHLAEDTR